MLHCSDQQEINKNNACQLPVEAFVHFSLARVRRDLLQGFELAPGVCSLDLSNSEFV